jgi:hypothetical protein
MSKISAGTQSDIRWALYITFALMVGMISLGASYISDGAVGFGVHFIAFLLPVIIFVLPPLVWMRLKAKHNNVGRGQ